MISTLRQVRTKLKPIVWKFFSSNPPQIYEPVNDLERLLQDAAVSPHKRPDFYREMFNADLVVIGAPSTNNSSADAQNENGVPVQIQIMTHESGDPIVLAFTSLEALQYYLSSGLSEEKHKEYIRLDAKTLIPAIYSNKMGMLLNMGHQYGKRFTTYELENLCKDVQADSQTTLSKDDEIIIGQPEVLPTNILKALNEYMKSTMSLVEIYFGQMAVSQNGVQRVEYLGILQFLNGISEEEKNRITNDALVISRELLPDARQSIVLVHLTNDFAAAISDGVVKPIQDLLNGKEDKNI